MDVYRIDVIKEEEIKEIISFTIKEMLLRYRISISYDVIFDSLLNEILKKLKDKNK